MYPCREVMELLAEVEESLRFVLGRPTTSVWVIDNLAPVTRKLSKILDEEWWPGSTDEEED